MRGPPLHLFGSALLAATLLLGATPARAAWPPDGLAIATGPGSQIPAAIVPDDAGGAFVLWVDEPTGTTHVQRVTSSGTVAPGWPPSGISLGVAGFQAATRDGAGGVVVFLSAPPFSTLDIFGRDFYATRLDGSGQFPTGWPAGGVLVHSEIHSWLNDDYGYEGLQDQQAVPDVEGGAWFAAGYIRDGGHFSGWRFYRVLGDATRGADWGRVYAELPFGGSLDVEPNSSGGITCMMRTTDFGALRHLYSALFEYDATGSVLGSLPQPDDAGFTYHALVRLQPGTDLLVSSSGGSAQGAALARLTESLVPAAGWPPGTVSSEYVPLLSDLQGGAFCRVNVGGSDLVQHVMFDTSTPVPLWSPGDLRPWRGGLAVADKSGGLFQLWLTTTGLPPTTLHALHLGSNGNPGASFPDTGIVLSADAGPLFFAKLATVAPGVAMAGWADQRAGDNDVYLVALQEGTSTSVAVSFAAAVAGPDRVVIDWQWADSPAEPTVERQREGGSWTSLGTPLARGPGHWRYVDLDVHAGESLRYRLSTPAGAIAGSEAGARVPATSRLELRSVRLEPTTGLLTVSLVLPDAAPARLELFDLTGRRIASRDVGALGAGEHQVSLGDAGLPPGMLFARLMSRGLVLGSRTAVLR